MSVILDVSDLRVELSSSRTEIVDDISFSLEEGEVVGLVGESGSGKTTVAVALLGHAKRGTRIAAGSVRVAGEEILGRDATALRAARGRLVSYVPQDPAAALNPALSIGRQLSEVIAVHRRNATSTEIRARVEETLAEVKLPSDSRFLRRYPHQLSGGQQQRACIAMAFLLRPRVIVLDEPTTGLDVTTQAHVLDTVRQLCTSHQVAALYVSHDLAAVASLAQRMLVMYAGRLVEAVPIDRLFGGPAHPYTRKLIAAVPDIAGRRTLDPIPGHVPAPGHRPTGCVFAPRCPDVLPSCTTDAPRLVQLEKTHHVACFRAVENQRPAVRLISAEERVVRRPVEPLLVVRAVDAFHGELKVLDGVSFELRPKECLALVGESGSGKTTLARTIMGVHPLAGGEISFKGVPLGGRASRRPLEIRRTLQYIFQSPYNSLNPRHTVGEILRVPIAHFFHVRGRAAMERVEAALERVSLPTGISAAYPDELSGGERQRVAIARALVCEPEILIADEITSALDVSVQAAIVGLLEDLREREGLAVVFVTHNLALVRTIADRIIVLNRGSVVESGTSQEVIDRPVHVYTRELIGDTPTVAGLTAAEGSPERTAISGA